MSFCVVPVTLFASAPCSSATRQRRRGRGCRVIVIESVSPGDAVEELAHVRQSLWRPPTCQPRPRPAGGQVAAHLGGGGRRRRRGRSGLLGEYLLVSPWRPEARVLTHRPQAWYRGWSAAGVGCSWGPRASQDIPASNPGAHGAGFTSIPDSVRCSRGFWRPLQPSSYSLPLGLSTGSVRTKRLGWTKAILVPGIGPRL